MGKKNKWESVGRSLRWLPLRGAWKESSLDITFFASRMAHDTVDSAWVFDQMQWEISAEVYEELRRGTHVKECGGGKLE